MVVQKQAHCSNGSTLPSLSPAAVQHYLGHGWQAQTTALQQAACGEDEGVERAAA